MNSGLLGIDQQASWIYPLYLSQFLSSASSSILTLSSRYPSWVISRLWHCSSFYGWYPAFLLFDRTGCTVLFVCLYWVKLALCPNIWWIWEKVPWSTGKKVYSLGFYLNGLQMSFRSVWFMVPLNIRIPLFSFVWITCILLRVRYGNHALSLG